MVNIDGLQNLTIPNIVPDLSPDTLLTTIPTVANQTTNNYFGLILLVGICSVMIYTLNRDDWAFRLDILRSSIYSTGFSTILGLIMLLTGFITNYQHVMYFGIPFIFLIIIVYFKKEKGQ